MDLLLVSNNLSSALLIISAWWLAHEYSRNGWKWTASLVAAIGFSTLVTALARNIGVDPRWFIVVTKTIIATTFVFLVFSNSSRRKHENQMEQIQ